MSRISLLLAALLAAAAPVSAAPKVRVFAGVWKGPVTVTPNNCVWQVTASVAEKNDFATGNFTYSGPCAGGLQSGTFRARPAGQGCYRVDARVPGMPGLQFSACFEDGGIVTLDSMLIKGSVKLSEENRKAALSAASLLGGAAGTLRKTLTPPPGKGAKQKPAGALKPPTLRQIGAD